jgi:hypothetical protein
LVVGDGGGSRRWIKRVTDRLSHPLRQAGGRGKTDKHRLMRHAADTLDAVETTLAAIDRALERGDINVVVLRLRDIAKLLGCENVVMHYVTTDRYKDKAKHKTYSDGS